MCKRGEICSSIYFTLRCKIPKHRGRFFALLLDFHCNYLKMKNLKILNFASKKYCSFLNVNIIRRPSKMSLFCPKKSLRSVLIVTYRANLKLSHIETFLLEKYQNYKYLEENFYGYYT